MDNKSLSHACTTCGKHHPIPLVLKLRCECGERWERAFRGRRMPANRELLLAMRCPACGSVGEATGEPIEVRSAS